MRRITVLSNEISIKLHSLDADLKKEELTQVEFVAELEDIKNQIDDLSSAIDLLIKEQY